MMRLLLFLLFLLFQKGQTYQILFNIHIAHIESFLYNKYFWNEISPYLFIDRCIFYLEINVYMLELCNKDNYYYYYIVEDTSCD